ncbi:hypothetical protein GCM10008096_29130 [Zhihengliuella salsuginis]|uniref:Uncharacterized protein n=1 Tax=Zhihengliuella salsuginis TaxID=578222 RepID=A0ABQ3GMI6_9MICC|nr:hypothetical protein GCM10008096_29130 [Zhihengliuella salsuginis]
MAILGHSRPVQARHPYSRRLPAEARTRTPSRLASADLSDRLRTIATDRDAIANVEEVRDTRKATEASRQIAQRGQWAPATMAKRMSQRQARRGRELTASEAAWLEEVAYDFQAWSDRARSLLAQDDVSAWSIADATGIATPTVHQRLRRYPATG